MEVEVLDRKECVFLDERGVFASRLLAKQVPPCRFITGAHHKLLHYQFAELCVLGLHLRTSSEVDFFLNSLTFLLREMRLSFSHHVSWLDFCILHTGGKLPVQHCNFFN